MVCHANVMQCTSVASGVDCAKANRQNPLHKHWLGELDKEYLEDYDQREFAGYNRLLKDIQGGKFALDKSRFPPDERFPKLQEPVTVDAQPIRTSKENENILWAQVPFSGSLIVRLTPTPQSEFEKRYFKISNVEEIIDFAKNTGRLQFALTAEPSMYQGLDYLEPIFRALNPPMYYGIPDVVFGNEKEAHMADDTFNTIGRVRYIPWFRKQYKEMGASESIANGAIVHQRSVYVKLKLGHYAVAEDIENLMIDDPERARWFINLCGFFITDYIADLRCHMRNHSLDIIKLSQTLPYVHRPRNIRFPCEIGKFLMKDKLTYAPWGLEACKDIIYHYNAYDLQKVQASLNEAIVTNHPDIVSKSTEEISEILDNVWSDKTIPSRIKNIEIGVPVSIAAIGVIVAGLPGLFAGGFLSELGFKIAEKATEKYAEKLFSVKGEGLTERLAKLRTKSYQANIYDFKKKYNK
ncbi:hypothetical protein MUP01_04635 [Candidatus Bathyarchaeota archaeon]|nr:hypothetical protein [Candidatus Bathyarchaeota archaeon]